MPPKIYRSMLRNLVCCSTYLYTDFRKCSFSSYPSDLLLRFFSSLQPTQKQFGAPIHLHTTRFSRRNNGCETTSVRPGFNSFLSCYTHCCTDSQPSGRVSANGKWGFSTLVTMADGECFHFPSFRFFVCEEEEKKC